MTLPRAAFERAVRRLDGPRARGFVADLLEARGHRTTVEGRVVTATDGPGGSTRLLVVDGVRSLGALRAGRESVRAVDAVVVTGGLLAGPVGRIAARTRVGATGDSPTVLGPRTLYEWFAYAVDAESRSALADRYLDATEPTALGRGWTGLVTAAGTAGSRIGRARAPSRGAVGAVLAGLLVLMTAATAGPAGLLASVGPPVSGGDGVGGSTPSPSLTPVPATATSAPGTAEAGVPVPDVCPEPPLGVHPSVLRPGTRETATAGGLDGWRLLATQNLTRYDFDPNDQRAGVVPEVRHVGVFEAPDGTEYRLGLDRWGSPARAEEAVARGGPWGLGLPWGAYTAWVEWSPEEVTYAAAARNLLAAVTTPDGTRVGDACVSTLATGPATNATA